MKARVVLSAFVILVAVLSAGVVYLWNPQTSRGRDAMKARNSAFDIHKWLYAYALDNGGAFPRDLNELTKKSYGAENLEENLQNVIEYRGAGLTINDDPQQLLLRCRVKDRPGLECRVYLAGSGVVRAVNDF
ncbi:MAG TPA: hypothetical protein VG796_14970 [Verrucomicrobiales bacterium]|nr:hypothetical protein [Verrucomicrobiales bacterium]